MIGDLSRAWDEIQSVNRDHPATPAEQREADIRGRTAAIAAGVPENELPRTWGAFYDIHTNQGAETFHRLLVNALLKYGNPPAPKAVRRVPVWTPDKRAEYTMKFRDCFCQRDAERYAHDMEFCGAIFALVGINLNDDNTCTIHFQLPKGRLEAFKQKFRTTYAYDYLAEPFQQRAKRRRPSVGGKPTLAAQVKALRNAMRK